VEGIALLHTSAPNGEDCRSLLHNVGVHLLQKGGALKRKGRRRPYGAASRAEKARLGRLFDDLEVVPPVKLIFWHVLKTGIFNSQAILENLKPRQERTEKDLVQVKFTGNNKDIVGNFKSVLKVWRIMKPVIIDLTSEGLDDTKIKDLSELLIEFVPLIRSLCVRRNGFGDVGAEALAKLISKKLQRFIYLEMSRNKVTDKGAIKILEALKENTRVKTLFIDYGNDIKNKKIVQDIQIEVEANNQINKEAKKYL
jgi:hypothetical protein